jgi:hypothetical protein
MYSERVSPNKRHDSAELIPYSPWLIAEVTHADFIGLAPRFDFKGSMIELSRELSSQGKLPITYHASGLLQREESHRKHACWQIKVS